MRFSEAMMLGLPEIFFRNDCWLQGGWDAGGGGEKCAGCLVGAALWAEGFRKEPFEYLRHDSGECGHGRWRLDSRGLVLYVNLI